jgi:hypothetical protein
MKLTNLDKLSKDELAILLTWLAKNKKVQEMILSWSFRKVN